MTKYLECKFDDTNFLVTPEVGDWFVTSLSVLLEKRELYLSFARRIGNVSSTVVEIKFIEVCAHHFDHVIHPSIAFGIEETNIGNVYNDWEHVFKNGKNNRWPVEYSSKDDLIKKLTEEGLSCYKVYGTCGLHGFILAEKLEYRKIFDHKA